MNLKATIAITLASLSVLAAADDARALDISARIGTFLPIDTTAQSVGKMWLAGGLDFDLAKVGSFHGGKSALSLSLDYTYRQDFREVPVLVNYVVRRGALYFLVGAGINFSRADNDSGVPSDQTRFGYDVGVGFDFLKNAGNPIFAEGRFFGTDQSEFNAFGVYVGVRL